MNDLNKQDLVFILIRRNLQDLTKFYKLNVDKLRRLIVKITPKEQLLLNKLYKKRELYNINDYDFDLLEIPKSYPKWLKMDISLMNYILGKHNLVFILSKRTSITIRTLYDMNNIDLYDMLYNESKFKYISKNELNLLKKQSLLRLTYLGDIVYNSSFYNIPKAYNNNTKIDILLNYEIQNFHNPDENQQRIINNDFSMYCVAGPGSGKTFTLIKLVKNLYISNKTVLCLLSDINTKQDFAKKLEANAVKIIKKVNKKYNNGIYVFSIHEYAFRRGYRKLVCNKKTLSTKPINDTICRAISSSTIRTWDYVIIDEAQDITPNQYELIKSINCNNIIYMGDNRQNLHNKISVYKNLLLKERLPIYELVNNYRSNRNIIDFINKYSSIHFDKIIDIQQTYPENNIYSINNNKVEIEYAINPANIIVRNLLNYKPGETFIISPIIESDNKTTDLIKEYSCKYNRGLSILDLCSSIRNINVYDDYISDSFNVKGLERKQVIIYGVSNINNCIDNLCDINLLKCLLYVALSRAIEKLVIVIDVNKYTSPNLLDFCIDTNIVNSVKLNMQDYELPVSIYKSPIFVNDLTIKNIDIPYSIISTTNINKIYDEDTENTISIFMKGTIANSLKLLKPKYNLMFSNNINIDNEKCNIYVDDYIESTYSKTVKSFIDNIIKDKDKDNDNIIYAKVKYVAKTGICYEFDHKINTDYYLNELYEKGLNVIDCNIIVTKEIPIKNSNVYGGEIIYEIDLMTKDSIIQLCHSDKLDKINIQAGLYGLLLDKRSFVLNTYTGILNEVVLDWDIHKVQDYLRCIYVIEKVNKNLISSSYNVNENLYDGICVFIDIEFIAPNLNEIKEISMIVIDIKNSNIIDIFNEIIRSDKNTKSRQINNWNKSNFYNFVNKYDQYPFIQWGNSDCNILKINPVKTIDVSKIYKKYIEVHFSKGSSIKSMFSLSDAIKRLLPNIQWNPHIAFEDSLITLIVYYILYLFSK